MPSVAEWKKPLRGLKDDQAHTVNGAVRSHVSHQLGTLLLERMHKREQIAGTTSVNVSAEKLHLAAILRVI